MATLISRSPAETEALGETWGRVAMTGWVFALSGDLGAGKTQLVKGLARGLGIPQRVHSPTFALVNIYTGGRLPLFHLDLYRLETVEQIQAAGLHEHMRPQGVAVIEWAERWFGMPATPGSEVPLAPSQGVTQAEPSHGAVAGPPEAGCSVILRRVWLDTVSESARRIVYEDFGY